MSLRLRYLVLGEERSFDLEKVEVSLGRGTDNDVVLPDPSVSRRHAVLRRRQGIWRLVDLDSTNGVRVNRERVIEKVVRAGDVLQVGNFALELLEVPAEWERDATSPGDGTLPDASVFAGRGAAPPLPGGPPPGTAPPAGAVPTSASLAAAPSAPPARPSASVAPSASVSAPGATVIRPLADFAAEYGLSTGDRLPVDKRKVLEQAYSNRIVGYLTRLAGLLLTADSVDQVLARVMGIAFEALPVQRGYILLLDDEGEAVCQLAREGDEVRFRPQGEVPVSRTMLAEVMRDRVALITLDAQSDQRLNQGESIRLHQIRAAICAPLWSADRIVGVVQLDTPYRTGTFTEQDLDFLTALANYAAVAVERLRYAETVEREQRFRERLERYHSPPVIEAVMSRDDVAGEMERLQSAEATVLFADLVGFTALAETLAPHDVADLLADFFNLAVEAIFAAGGTLDKFIGDCVMAFFGAPVAQSDHALRGVQAAIDIQRRLSDWNREQRQRILDATAAFGIEAPPAIESRIGLNSGPVVVGEVGSSRRVDYTVLGNTVNVAARLEALVARPGDVVLGGETHRLLAGAVETEALGPKTLKGLTQKVDTYRVVRRW